MDQHFQNTKPKEEEKRLQESRVNRVEQKGGPEGTKVSHRNHSAVGLPLNTGQRIAFAEMIEGIQTNGTPKKTSSVPGMTKALRAVWNKTEYYNMANN